MKIYKILDWIKDTRMFNVFLASFKSLLGSLLLAFLILYIPGSVFGYEVRVQVTNGTIVERVPEGLPLTLYILKRGEHKESGVLKSLKDKTDSEGLATFTLKERGDGLVVGATVEYKGVTYRSDILPITDKKDVYNLSLNVYELSDDEGLVDIEERSVFIQGIKDKTLNIMEMIRILNGGNKTYVGRFNEDSQLTETVRIGLPIGYEDPTLDGPVDTGQVRTMGNGLVFLEKIPPGEKIILMTYKLKSDIGRFELYYPVSTPQRAFRLLVPDNLRWRVRVKQLKQVDKIRIGERVFRQWEGKNFGRIGGDKKSLSIQMLESIGFFSGPRIILKDPVISGAGFGRNEVAIISGLILSLIIGFFYIKKKDSSFGIVDRDLLSEERNRLLRIVKRLDKEVANDKRVGEYYRPYRGILVNRVREIDDLLQRQR